LSNDELKYSLNEKHTFSLLKGIEKNCLLILGKHNELKLHLLAVNFMLSQTHLSRKITHWLAKLQEYNFTISTSNTIKEHELDLNLAQHPKLECFTENIDVTLSTLFLTKYKNIDLARHPWYQNIIYYLQHG
jgi:hypothetical protein